MSHLSEKVNARFALLAFINIQEETHFKKKKCLVFFWPKGKLKLIHSAVFFSQTIVSFLW